MPCRYIRDAILTSRRWNSLPPAAREFYLRLLLVVDDAGRFFADPVILKNTAYPRLDAVRTTDVSRYVELCAATLPPMLVCYEVNGERYLEVDGFGQIKRNNRSASKFPAPYQSVPDGVQSVRKNEYENEESYIPREITMETAEMIEIIAAAYPRTDYPEEAKRAIASAAQRKADIPGNTLPNALEYLYQRTLMFASAKADADPEFIPGAARWFNGGGYDADPESWKNAPAKPAGKKRDARNPESW